MATKKTSNAKPAEDKATDQPAEDKATDQPAEAIIAKVVHRFRDKDTGSVLQSGMTIAVSPERFDEICEVGDYLERIQ